MMVSPSISESMIQSPLNIDFMNPLYLHPSDTLSTVLVSHQLTDPENYCVWSRSMRIALLAKNKQGFVHGTFPCSDLATELHGHWARCNALVLSWIINTVSSQLSAGIVFASNTATVWKDLKERFDKVDGSRIYHLHRAIATQTQGTSTVSAYFSNLRLLWDEYDVLVNWVTILTDKYGQPKGFAYVEFLEVEAVQEALLLNESELHGRQLKEGSKVQKANAIHALLLKDGFCVDDIDYRVKTAGWSHSGSLVFL